MVKRQGYLRLLGMGIVVLSTLVGVAQEALGQVYDSVKESTYQNTKIPLWDWASSKLTVNKAPENAVVHHMDVYFRVTHPCVGDIDLLLANEYESKIHTLVESPSGPYGCTRNVTRTVYGITTFAGFPVNQSWRLLATDWAWGDDGYIDAWWIKIYYTTPAAPAHDTIEKAIVLEESVAYRGTTLGASGNLESPDSWFDSRDVWHVYTALERGLATLSLEGSQFDTTLAVYDPGTMECLASSDDVLLGCEEPQYWSRLVVPLVDGQSVLVRVAGLTESMGDYTLKAHTTALALPDIPHSPFPREKMSVSAHAVYLAWNQSNVISAQSHKSPAPHLPGGQVTVIKSIYGIDDRLDEYEITNSDLLNAGQATGIMMSKDQLRSKADGSYTLSASTLAQQLNAASGFPMCPGEAFSRQPALSGCTSFLVAPDIIATAGHCVACPGDIEGSVVVFGFVMLDAKNANLTLTHDNVYFCREILGYMEGTPDWALVKLDRAVVNRHPLRVRRAGQLEDNQALTSIGHPLGLPRKYDSGGRVYENIGPLTFQANLDAFAGSSGSPVLNRETLEVEGILVGGNSDLDLDFVNGDFCFTFRKYANDSGGLGWESCTRTTTFSDLVPSYDIYLGTAPNQLELIRSYEVAPELDPIGLAGSTTYYWQVVARSYMGTVAGPVWSFTTK